MSDSMYGFTIRDLTDAIKYFSDKIVVEEASYYEALQKEVIQRDCDKERELTFMRIASLCIKKELAFIKEEPLRPFNIRKPYGFKVGTCYACENRVDERMKYCDKCGQKIDWEV